MTLYDGKNLTSSLFNYGSFFSDDLSSAQSRLNTAARALDGSAAPQARQVPHVPGPSNLGHKLCKFINWC